MELTDVHSLLYQIARERDNPLNGLILISPWHQGMMDITLEFKDANWRRLKREQNKFNRKYRKANPPLVGGINRDSNPFWFN